MPQLSRIIRSVLCKKPSLPKTPSLDDFALDSDIIYDFEGWDVQKEFVETMPRCCCRNATPVLRMDGPASIILT